MPERSACTTRLVTLTHALFLTGALTHLILVCVQPVLAGWSLDGNGTALELHGINGSMILTLSMVLIPLSILWWRPGHGTLRAPVLTVLLFAAETFQLGMGYADILVIHVALGVGIVLASVRLVGLVLASAPALRTRKAHR